MPTEHRSRRPGTRAIAAAAIGTLVVLGIGLGVPTPDATVSIALDPTVPASAEAVAEDGVDPEVGAAPSTGAAPTTRTGQIPDTGLGVANEREAAGGDAGRDTAPAVPSLAVPAEVSARAADPADGGGPTTAGGTATKEPTSSAPSAPQQPQVARPVLSGAALVIPVEPVGAVHLGRTVTAASAAAEIDRAKAKGAVGIRVTVDMNWMCSSATCDFSALAPVISAANVRGMKVFLHVNSMPVWLDSRGRWYGPTGTTGQKWAALFAQLTDRFGTSVAGYEVWNEPNLDDYWKQGQNPAEYADLLKSVWTAVKPSQPNVKIIAGALSNNDLGWMRQLSSALKAIGGNAQNRYYYDVIGIHPYTGAAGVGYDPTLPAGARTVDLPRGQKDMTLRGLARVRDQIAAQEGIQRNVFVGEFGYSTIPGRWYHVAEPRRAQYFTKALSVIADWPWLEGFTVYSYSDDSEGFSVLGTASENALRTDR